MSDSAPASPEGGDPTLGPVEAFASAILKVLPSLRTRIQLTGFAIGVVLVFFIYFVRPDNTAAQISGGTLGLLVTVFPLFFYNIEKFPPSDRVKIVVTILYVFSTVMVTLAIITALLLFFLTPQRREAEMYRQSVAQYAQRLKGEVDILKQRIIKLQRDADTTTDFGIRQSLLAEKDEAGRKLSAAEATLQDIKLAPQSLSAINFSERDRPITSVKPLDVNQRFIDAIYDSVAAGRLGEGEKLLDSAVQDGQAVLADFFARRAWIRELAGNVPGAIDDLKKVSAVNGQSARAQMALSRLLQYQGDVVSAAEAAKKAFDLYRADHNYGLDGLMAARQLAMLQRLVGAPAEAIKTAETALNSQRDASVEARVVRANILGDLSIILTTSGDFKKSGVVTEEALALIQELEADAAKQSPGMRALALAARPASAALGTAPAPVFGASSVWAAAGHYYAYRGDFSKALQYHREAGRRPPEIGSGVSIELANLRINEGVAQMRTGDIAKGYENIKSGWAITDQSTGKDSYYRLRTLLWLAEAALALGHDGEAVEYIKTADTIADALVKMQPSEASFARTTLASVAVVAKFPGANSLIRKAEDVLLPDSSEVRVRFYSRLFKIVGAELHPEIASNLVALRDELLAFIRENSLDLGYYDAEVHSWFIREARKHSMGADEIGKSDASLKEIFRGGACSESGYLGRIANS